ncbi:hypothetical protein BLNAU_8649 [Blattamonas nauphoetae]|uniref:Uncharacterized protein n=1 Tax=Blattamonas nauphoetae TaxID=2049346 RepID=A0ABQ9XY66_9EUKA|nr:hypothetical protein BLNAU_8649 [Blattamonas nauphoetae]
MRILVSQLDDITASSTPFTLTPSHSSSASRTLRRRRRAQKEKKVDEESESEETLDEILNVDEGETDASKEGDERGRETEGRSESSRAKDMIEKKETDKPAPDKDEKKAKKEKTTLKPNEGSLLSGKTVPANQNTDTTTLTTCTSLISGPSKQNKTLFVSHHPNAAGKATNQPLLLSDTPFFNTFPNATLDVSEIPSRAHAVDSPLQHITTIHANSGTTSDHSLLSHSFGALVDLDPFDRTGKDSTGMVLEQVVKS